MFGPYRIPYIDALYFWDSNVDHRVGRAMMQRNFSNISVGVLKQVRWHRAAGAQHFRAVSCSGWLPTVWLQHLSGNVPHF